MPVHRRSFLALLPATAVLPALPVSAGTQWRLDDDDVARDLYPTTDPALVREIVGAAHANIDRVREIVTDRPHLARAGWDWGFGDWETALGAASHMGRRDIAELLLAHGARPNIFTAAMMGWLDVVRSFVEASPGVQRIPGPHGITLLTHARQGGDDARDVHDYLESLGDADERPQVAELSDEEKTTYIGTYVFGEGATERFHVELMGNGGLGIKREGYAFGRRIFSLGGNTFFPSGSPDVRIVFAVADGRVRSLSVHDPSPLVTATRIA